MNPKNARKNMPKATPKKKVKSNSARAAESNDIKSKQSDAKMAEEEPKKLERSNSFISRGLSKIFHAKFSSKENLVDRSKVNEKQDVVVLPNTLQRSLTLNSIQTGKNYRKTLPELRLEKLSEEKINENEKTKSPPMSPPVIMRSRSPASYRQSMPVGAFDDIDFLKPPTPLTPQAAAPLQRSGSFINLIRRKISFNEVKTESMTPAASLQSLQKIDNFLVSYDDLSFVDYDKFNKYEQQIDKMRDFIKRKAAAAPVVPVQAENPVVLRRRPNRAISHTGNDFNNNLDRAKNLYRQSIDSNKLRMLSSMNAESFNWRQNPYDWLSLDDTPHDIKHNKVPSVDMVDSSPSIVHDHDPCRTLTKRKSRSCGDLLAPTAEFHVSTLENCHSFIQFNYNYACADKRFIVRVSTSVTWKFCLSLAIKNFICIQQSQ